MWSVWWGWCKYKRLSGMNESRTQTPAQRSAHDVLCASVRLWRVVGSARLDIVSSSSARPLSLRGQPLLHPSSKYEVEIGHGVIECREPFHVIIATYRAGIVRGSASSSRRVEVAGVICFKIGSSPSVQLELQSLFAALQQRWVGFQHEVSAMDIICGRIIVQKSELSGRM